MIIIDSIIGSGRQSCKTKLKCPGYYCLPFGYLCDGKSDCPFSEEEAVCDKDPDCGDMYRSRGTRQCIHLNDICDNTMD